MNLEDSKTELATFIGIPKCQDCGWKLGSELTDNCQCRGEGRFDIAKHLNAFKRARELQKICQP